MKAVIEIKMDNAAFSDEHGPHEIARILQGISDGLINYGFPAENPGALRDNTGDRVGTFRIER